MLDLAVGGVINEGIKLNDSQQQKACFFLMSRTGHGQRATVRQVSRGGLS